MKNSNLKKKKEYFLNGIFVGLGFFFILGIIGTIFAVGFHVADEILPGTFIGNFNFDGNVSIQNIDITPLNESKTIYLDNSMTAQDIQNIIDAQPKHIAYGNSLIFQFTDGTYILNQTLYFSGFYGGTLIIQGNISEIDANVLHTTQKVILDFSSVDINGIYTSSNNQVYIYNLHIKINSNLNWRSGIYTTRNSHYSTIRYNFIEGTSTTYGSGISHFYGATGDIRFNYLSNINRGLQCGYTICFSYGNDDTGILPTYGLYSSNGASIGIYSTQPSGSTANQNSVSGGIIRS